ASFWGFVLPHGVLEIPAILIAGAAGLVIGYAIIAPGRLYRADALRLAMRRAIPLVLGVMILLVMAGLIEGFFSPIAEIEPAKKMAVALFNLFCLVSWLGLGG